MAHVCIVTPTGMVCASSPLKLHKAGAEACVNNHPHPNPAKAQKVKDAMAAPGAGYTAAEQDLIGRVVDLMITAGVNPDQHFTIIHSK
jgi:hypothetical protein